jgi:hypothetical protein
MKEFIFNSMGKTPDFVRLIPASVLVVVINSSLLFY